MRNPGRTVATWALLGLAACTAAHAGGSFASIDGDEISYEEFERFVYAESRQTFYHGAPLDEQGMIEFRRDAADKLIERELKIREAARLGLAPDSAAVDEKLSDYESRYGDTERWQADGDAMRAGLRAWLESESLLQQVDTALREVPEPGPDELRDFYQRNLEKFTRPEQVRVSVILKRVPPTANQEMWDEASVEAAAIMMRIREGASFAEQARQHSEDLTAPNGGDMGWLHRGTLGPDIEAALDELQPGELAEAPLRVLEGIVIARLEERRPATVVPFADAREQALALYRRETSDAAYARNIARLRDSSDIRVDHGYVDTASR